MSPRAFKFAMIALGVAILLSASALGSLIGFFFAITIAFFIAPPSFLAAAALRQAGFPVTSAQIGIALFALYFILTLISALIAYVLWRRGSFDAARLQGFKASVLLALPIMGYVSLQTMAAAWP